MAGWTNKGKMKLLEAFFRDGGTMRAVLLTDALDLSNQAVLADINTHNQLTEIPTGNGYSAGGILLTRNVTDFPTIVEDDSGNVGYVTVRDLSWIGDGGLLPASGTGARYMAFEDNNVTPGSREVYLVHDLLMLRMVSDGQPLNIGNTAGGAPIKIELADTLS